MSYHWTGVLRLFVGLGRRFLSQHFLVHIFFWLALSLQFFTEFHNFLIDDLQLKYNTVIKKNVHSWIVHDYIGFCVNGKISSQQAAHKDISLMLYQKQFPWGWLFTSFKVMFDEIWICLRYERLTLYFWIKLTKWFKRVFKKSYPILIIYPLSSIKKVCMQSIILM